MCKRVMDMRSRIRSAWRQPESPELQLYILFINFLHTFLPFHIIQAPRPFAIKYQVQLGDQDRIPEK
jgi:hypothetical protein